MDRACEPVVQHCVQLTITLYPSTLPNLRRCCRQFQTALAECTNVTWHLHGASDARVTTLLLRSLPGITHFECHKLAVGHWNGNCSWLVAVANSWSALTTVDVSHCTPFEDRELEELSQCSMLTSLDISGCKQLGPLAATVQNTQPAESAGERLLVRESSRLTFNQPKGTATRCYC